MARKDEPHEISCLALTLFYDYLKAHGIPRATLQENLPYPPSHLDNRLKWIDYQTFLKIEARMVGLFPDVEDLYFNIGRSTGNSGGFGFLMPIVQGLVSPGQIYRRIPTFMRRFMFPFCQISFEQISPLRIEGEYLFDEGFAPSEAFVETVRGVLSGSPVVIGWPEARVAMIQVEPLRYRAEIDLQAPPARRSVRSILSGLMRRRRSAEAVHDELLSANSLLQEKVRTLTAAQEALRLRVRDLTILNTLAREAASELDLERLLQRAAVAIADALDDTPTALLLLDERRKRLRVAACEGFSERAEAELRDVSGSSLLMLRTMLSDPERAPHRIFLAGEVWILVPLWSHDRLVGAAVLRILSIQDYEHALLESIASHVAVAIDNASAYKAVTELRDGLEVRVEERTAQLARARDALEDTVEQLEQADRAQREFFINISHEIKTPLSLILAPLDELEPELSRRGLVDGVGGLRTVRQSARVLTQLVDEILEFARLEAGAVQIQRVPVDLDRFLTEAVETFRALAGRRSLTLSYLPPEEDCIAEVDPRLLHRAVANLVTNAIKYISAGDLIEVQLRADGGSVVIQIGDTGPGIPADELTHIFERFRRATDAESRGLRGSGIGLALVRECVTHLDGVVAVESTLGSGTTFTITLPRVSEGAAMIQRSLPTDLLRDLTAELEQQALESTSSPSPYPEETDAPEYVSGAPRGRVLLVEDHDEMRAFLARVVGRRYEVLVAADGEEGLAIAREALPDVVLSDVMMPKMDGHTFCRELRADPATRYTKVILISARYGKDAAIEALEAGADDFLVKPFSTPELLARIRAQLRIRTLSLSLMRSENHRSLGVMAAGIAHEVRNPINAVINAVPPLRTLVEQIAGDEHGAQLQIIQRLLGAVEDSGHRVHRIVGSVLMLARSDDYEVEARVLRLSEGINAVLRMLQLQRLGSAVHLDFRWDEPMLCAPGLLDQVVMNLLDNACHAAGADGNVWLTTERDGEWVLLRVRDDGPGVPRADADRIFAPFYTTKPPGEGTGLGLAISRELVMRLGGSLELVPSDDGAEFLMMLPWRPPDAASSLEVMHGT